jgi:hypothetical protein
LSEFPAVPFTFVQQARPPQRVLFQPGSVLSYFPVDSDLPRFDRKVAPLLRSASFFELGDLDHQFIAALLIRQDIRFQLLILFLEVA